VPVLMNEKTEINGQRLLSEIPYPFRQSSPQQKGEKVRDPMLM